MGIHGFPRFLGKSGVYLYHPPSHVHAQVVLQKMRADPAAAAELLRTGDCLIAEAAPNDTVRRAYLRMFRVVFTVYGVFEVFIPYELAKHPKVQ